MDKKDLKIHLRSGAEDDPWQTSQGPLGWRIRRGSHSWRPPTDVLETENAFLVVVEVAGMRGADFNVTYEGHILSIKGNRYDSKERKAYHQMEIDYGEFMTEVHLPIPIEASEIEAAYSDGFLRIHLPKASPKKIAIED
ncbi:MAG: Hsp20/alpha crystallin family protein [Anaerolineales bacterium]|nr:MAG: Hsp20/alpha crystallin family protein [Anaerolineales bacterium]